MTIVTLGASGRLSPEEAWERYADLSLWPTWAPQITGVEASADRLGFGVTGRVFGPLGIPVVDFVIDAVDEQARRWSWTVRRWPLELRLEHAVGKQGGGSSTSLRMDGPLPVVVAYAPLARLALQRLVSKRPAPVVATEVPDIYVDPKDADRGEDGKGDGDGAASAKDGSAATPQPDDT